MASVMASGRLTTSFTASPVSCRRSSAMSGFSGSAVAKVSKLPSTLTGQTAYWRRYFDESPFRMGIGDGSSSRVRKVRFCCRARACSTSSLETAPMATRASPIRSPLRSARSIAWATTSPVVSPSSTRISPRSREADAIAMLCSVGMVAQAPSHEPRHATVPFDAGPRSCYSWPLLRSPTPDGDRSRAARAQPESSRNAGEERLRARHPGRTSIA